MDFFDKKNPDFTRNIIIIIGFLNLSFILYMLGIFFFGKNNSFEWTYS